MDHDDFLAAHHEAGHAIAAIGRGYAVTEVCLHPTEAFTAFNELPAPDDYALIVYAGPWAHARAEWPFPSIGDDLRDADGFRFVDRVVAQMQSNLDDWRKYEGLMPGGDERRVEAAELERLREFSEANDEPPCDENGDVVEHGLYWSQSPCDGGEQSSIAMGIAHPNEDWSSELAGTWTAVQSLARRFLADEPDIALERSVLRKVSDRRQWFDRNWTIASFCQVDDF